MNIATQSENMTEVGIGGEGTHYPFPTSPPLEVINRTGAATIYGDLYMFDKDFTVTAAESGTTRDGRTVTYPAVTHMGTGLGGAFGNIILPTVNPTIATNNETDNTATTFGVYCLALEVAADNAPCKVLAKGIFKNARVFPGSGTTVVASTTFVGGRRLSVATGVTSLQLQVDVSTTKALGITLANVVFANSTDVVTADVYFNGIEGVFGR